jgi:dCTP deaminase
MLSDKGILKAMDKGLIHIDPFNPNHLGPNSYDVCLGNWFYDVLWNQDGPNFMGPTWVNDGEKVWIPVGGTLLGMTKEVVGTHKRIVAQMHSRSSTMRSGISVCMDAGLGDVGYDNHWTVELSAHVTGLYSPFLIVGERFAQFSFQDTVSDVMKEYSGQYVKNKWPACMVPKKWRK